MNLPQASIPDLSVIDAESSDKAAESKKAILSKNFFSHSIKRDYLSQTMAATISTKWSSAPIYENHFHRFRGRTSGAVVVGDRHVHFIVDAKTTFHDGHRHEFRLATMLDDPIGD